MNKIEEWRDFVEQHPTASFNELPKEMQQAIRSGALVDLPRKPKLEECYEAQRDEENTARYLPATQLDANTQFDLLIARAMGNLPH